MTMQSSRTEATLTVPHAAMNVRDARDVYLAENGFSLAEYDESVGWVTLLGVRIPIRSQKRMRALRMHDLHHVALGFGTDTAGELEVSAWEHRTGTNGIGALPRCMIFVGLVAGLVLSPRRTLAAWRAGREHRSLYVAPLPKETLLRMTVGELRSHLGVPLTGLAQRAPKPHVDSPLRKPTLTARTRRPI